MPAIFIGEKSYKTYQNPPENSIANEYLKYLLSGKSHAARQLILEAAEQGFPVQRIYTDVFQWSQREIGYLWETNQINVADEHFGTAITQSIMAQLYPYISPKLQKDQKAIITCVPGELHEIGARMVADFLTMDGWDTYFLGANTPTESLIEKIQTIAPQILGISVTMPHHLPELMALIDKVTASSKKQPVKIMVGGWPFSNSPGLCQSLQYVDACMKDAGSVVVLANKLVSETEK